MLLLFLFVSIVALTNVVSFSVAVVPVVTIRTLLLLLFVVWDPVARPPKHSLRAEVRGQKW